MWRESSSAKAVNLVKKTVTVIEIMNFTKGIVFIGAPCIEGWPKNGATMFDCPHIQNA